MSSKHVLIMDEVDGMAGNEDRGGIQVSPIHPHSEWSLKRVACFFFFFFRFVTPHLRVRQEMIGLIKNSKIPIICMCNDRNHMKIRSLSNYCFDLRFQRPRLEQIKVLGKNMIKKRFGFLFLPRMAQCPAVN